MQKSCHRFLLDLSAELLTKWWRFPALYLCEVRQIQRLIVVDYDRESVNPTD